MKNNVLNICKITVFLVLFAFYYVFLTFYMTPFDHNLNNIRGFYGERKNSIDVLYYGGSASFIYNEPLRAFEKFGVVSYNYATDTIVPELYKYMIKDSLKNQDPELLIIDARAFQYRGTKVLPSEFAYRNLITGMRTGRERYDLIETLVPKYIHQDTWSYHFNLGIYHDNAKVQTYGNTFKMIFNKYISPNKTYHLIYDVVPLERVEYANDEVVPVFDETQEILDDLLKYLKTIDKKVLFIVCPYVERPEHKANFNFIQQKVLEAGFDFLDANDLNDTIKIDFRTDFYNEDHVNVFGADKYTDFLAQYVIDNYDIGDRRNNSNYKEWYELLPEWHSNIEFLKMVILKKMTDDSIDNNYCVRDDCRFEEEFRLKISD